MFLTKTLVLNSVGFCFCFYLRQPAFGSVTCYTKCINSKRKKKCVKSQRTFCFVLCVCVCVCVAFMSLQKQTKNCILQILFKFLKPHLVPCGRCNQDEDHSQGHATFWCGDEGPHSVPLLPPCFSLMAPNQPSLCTEPPCGPARRTPLCTAVKELMRDRN